MRDLSLYLEDVFDENLSIEENTNNAIKRHDEMQAKHAQAECEIVHLTFIMDDESGITYCGKASSYLDLVEINDSEVKNQYGDTRQRSRVNICPDCMAELECYTRFDLSSVSVPEGNKL